MMDMDQRFDRIDNASYVVFLDDKSIHTVEDIQLYDNMILILTESGYLFNDMDVFTVEEMVDVEEKVEELIKNS